MSISTLENLTAIQQFLARKRPPENIRHQLDMGYKIEDQSIILFEIRPPWDNPEVILELHFAKTTFVKANNHWKVFWSRASGKWESYSPKPTVKTLSEFFKLVEEDKHHCFFG